MRRAPATRGFTLMEIMMVLIVGAAILSGGTLLYNTLRHNAAAANANARTAALQGLVERLISENPGQLPTADAVRNAWHSSRRDSKSSPWGGAAVCNDGTFGCDPDRPDRKQDESIRDLPVCDTPENSRCFDAARQPVDGDNGVLVYLHYTRGSLQVHKGNPYIDVWDHAQKQYVHTSTYAVASEDPSGKQFFFVQGPPNLGTDGHPIESGSALVSPTNCACTPQDLTGIIGTPSGLDR